MPIGNCRPLGAMPPGGGIADLNDAGGGGGGGTTDFTLANLQTEEQFACAFDAAGDMVGWVFRVIEDNLGEGLTVGAAQGLLLVDLNGAVTNPYTPAGAGHTLGTCSEAAAFEVDVHEMCDDINGDGSLIVRYFEFAKIELDNAGNLTRTVTGTFDDDRQSNVYAPVNGVECETIGVQVVGLEPRRIVLDGAGTWQPPAGEILTSVSIETRTIASAVTPPTITDGAGNTTPLFEGTETFEAEWLAGSGGLTGSPLTVTSNAGDLLVIIFTVADT